MSPMSRKQHLALCLKPPSEFHVPFFKSFHTFGSELEWRRKAEPTPGWVGVARVSVPFVTSQKAKRHTAPHRSLSFCSQVLIVDLCADKFVVQVCTQRRVFAWNERRGSRWPCPHLSPPPGACVCNAWRATHLLFGCTPAEVTRGKRRLVSETQSNQRVEPLKTDFLLSSLSTHTVMF